MQKMWIKNRITCINCLNIEDFILACLFVCRKIDFSPYLDRGLLLFLFVDKIFYSNKNIRSLNKLSAFWRNKNLDIPDIFHIFFDTIQKILDENKLDFHSNKICFCTHEIEDSLLFYIGNNPVLVLSPYRFETRNIYYLLESKSNHYSNIALFSGSYKLLKSKYKLGNRHKYDLLSFVQKDFWDRNYSENRKKIENEFSSIIQELLKEANKVPHSLKNKNRKEFYLASINREDRNDFVQSILQDNNKLEETQVEDEDEEFEDYKFQPEDVYVRIEQKSLDSIISRLKYKNINLSPDFQRSSDLWTQKVMSRFIESILLKLPLPPLYFDSYNDDNWIIIDGLQRLSTFQKFILEEEKPLILKDLKVLSDFNGKTYQELPGSMKRRLNETQITVNLLYGNSPEVRYSTFYRLNTGGLVLNPQEIRNALNQQNRKTKKEVYGPVALIELSKILEDKFKIKDTRMQAREIVLRFFAFQLQTSKDYNNSMRKFLDKAYELFNYKSENEIRKEIEKFQKTINACIQIFHPHTFQRPFEIKGKFTYKDNSSKVVYKFNRSIYDVWMYYVSKLDDDQTTILIDHRDKLKEKFAELFQDSRIKKSFSNDTTKNFPLKYRFNKIFLLIQEYIPKFQKDWTENDTNFQDILKDKKDDNFFKDSKF